MPHFQRFMVPPQVIGELRKAMEDIASFNRIVWDEVTQTCKEESVRISNSFRLRAEAQHAQRAGAQGLPDPDGLQSSPVSQQSSKGQDGGVSWQSAANAGMGAGSAEHATQSFDSPRLQAEEVGTAGDVDDAGSRKEEQNVIHRGTYMIDQSRSCKGDSKHSLAGSSASQRQQPAGPGPGSQADREREKAHQPPQGMMKAHLGHPSSLPDQSDDL